jgi:hypothetical protein
MNQGVGGQILMQQTVFKISRDTVPLLGADFAHSEFIRDAADVNKLIQNFSISSRFHRLYSVKIWKYFKVFWMCQLLLSVGPVVLLGELATHVAGHVN